MKKEYYRKAFNDFKSIIKQNYNYEFNKGEVHLHRPVFPKQINEDLKKIIQGNMISSVGPQTEVFEKKLCKITNSKFCLATTSGTSAIHLILKAMGCNHNSEIITQSLTFVGTVNAILYCNASPVFIDSDLKTFGMSHLDLNYFLDKNYIRKGSFTFNKKTKKKLIACMPVHIFGVPCDIVKIKETCKKWNIALVEDCAEALFSYSSKRHLGTFGIASAFSFNGNKIITTGGGGAIITNNKKFYDKLKLLATTAKKSHSHKYIHTQMAYNLRMPAINAQIGLTQLKFYKKILSNKKKIHIQWKKWALEYNFGIHDVKYFNDVSNYWLNAIIFPNKNIKNYFVKESIKENIFVRSIWELMHTLSWNKLKLSSNIKNAKYIYENTLCIPSSVFYDKQIKKHFI